MKLIAAAAIGVALMPPFAFSQTVCRAHEAALAGSVRDSTQALIPGAALSLDGHRPVISGADGRFRFPCVSAGNHRLTVTAAGFAEDDATVSAPHATEVRIVLQPGEVHVDVNVNAEDQTVSDPDATGLANTVAGKRLQSLADDPDDLLRELQQLGAAAGGNPASTTIAVDGFQDSSKLPPKSAIAYIKINPDMFSAEYREPPFDGGRVEVYTKPGQSAFHGALFATNGSPWMNARDPFSPGKAALGKQRYGFELTGPVRKQGSDFSLDLEHRTIDNYGVVNAITLDANGNQVSTVANVPTPQQLWIGEARLDWQLGQKNTLIASYSANVNHLENVGVGGVALPEDGYNSGQGEHTLRITDVTTASAHLMHEARASFRWNLETDVPTSTAPQLQVAGAFTGGGASIGNQRAHDLRIEVDDDAIYTTKAHTMKFGTELITYHANDEQTLNFNGTYTFGGGTAPVLDASGNPTGSETETITGTEQYRRALLGLPGGTATAFTGVTGTPRVEFTQVRDALFFQDDWNAGHGVHLSTGLRYFLQSDPVSLNSIGPRLGVLWSPTPKGTWTLHAHAGLFASQIDGNDWEEIQRENGTARLTNTFYNPVYCVANAASGCNGFAGLTAISSYRSLAPHVTNGSYAIENIGGTRTLPFGWNLSLDYYTGRIWNLLRSKNVNAPLNGQPTGPRLLGIPNTDILQVQNSSQGHADVVFAGVENHTLKRVQLFFGGVRVNLLDDNDDSTFSTPQSTFSNVGELAHRVNQPVWNIFGNASFNLPKKVVLSGNLNGNGDAHYNVVTGFDNNGDGDFNDRPQYAAPGTPLCTVGSTSETCAYSTAFGLLVNSGGTGVFPRNKGQIPWRFYLDTNLERVFTVSRNPKAEHQQTLTVNVRSANVLNHTNVTSVGGVLGSPLFGVPYAADNGRRVEAGLRYSF